MADDALGGKVARGVAWAGAAQAIIAVADLVSILLVTVYWVSPGALGVVGPILPFYTALDYIADLGVANAVIQHDDHTPAKLSTVFWLNVLVSTALFVVLLGVGPIIAWVTHQSVVTWLLLAYASKLFIQNLYAIPFALLRKELRFRDVAIARIIAHLAESVSRIVYAALGLSYWSFTLAAITRAFVFAIVIQTQHRFIPQFVFKPREVMSYVKFGLRTASSNVLYQVYTSVDALVISHYFGPIPAGIYTLADTFILEPVKTIANVVIDVAFPAFAKLRTDKRAVAGQLIRFTRLNLLAVLPYTVIILLVAPEILNQFWLGHGGGTGKDDVAWTATNVELCADAARILCVMGFFRSLGYLGPPLLDGIGRADLTLRYMLVAAVAVPGSFIVAAKLLGGSIGFLSVAVAWAIGYPIAFAVLAYLVIHTIKLPIREYVSASWGIIACCAIGCGVGFAVDNFVVPNAANVIRLVAIGGSALLVIGLLLVYWQKITPRSIASSMR
ncbi:MAG: oligosaccharide flippase family protein [Kofleriaceae bacterium]